MNIDALRVLGHELARDIHELDVDRHATELAFAHRFEDLSARANDLSVALQNYSPAPVKPIVRYARMLHEVDSEHPVAVQEQRYALQVIQGDEWHLPQVRALTNTVKLRYATPVARRGKDPLGDSTCLPPGQIPDAWMLRDTAGGIIARARDGDQFVDVGNPQYQKAAAAYLVKRCTQEGWDGVWLDEINPDPRYSFKNNDKLPVAYSTAYRYQVAIRSFVNQLAPALRQAGLQVWINLAGDYDDAWTNGLAKETDGHTIEFFVARYPHETGSLVNGYFGEALNWVTRRAGEKKPGYYHAQTTDPALACYALATVLLATEGDALFGAGVDGYPVSGTVWTEDMGNARKLGQPIGGYRVTDGLYSRDFEHGRVVVNPTTQPITTMPATSGLIELR